MATKYDKLNVFATALLECDLFEEAGIPASYLALAAEHAGLTWDDISIFFGNLLTYEPESQRVSPGPSWNAVKEKYQVWKQGGVR